MYNLFKRQWLPTWIRECINMQFPKKHHYTVQFEIDGKRIDMDQVKGNERKVTRYFVTFTDSEGNKVEKWVSIIGKITHYEAIEIPTSFFIEHGVDPEFRKHVRVGKKKEVEKVKNELKHRLSELIDYCPGSQLDQANDYPVTDIPRWRRRRLLSLLANMSENSIPVYIKFDLDNVALDQLEQFSDELEMAAMVKNAYDENLISEEASKHE